MEQITESFELYGKQYTLSTGELAKQASGAVKVTQGDTTVLVTTVISEQEKDYDFFPLRSISWKKCTRWVVFPAVT